MQNHRTPHFWNSDYPQSGGLVRGQQLVIRNTHLTLVCILILINTANAEVDRSQATNQVDYESSRAVPDWPATAPWNLPASRNSAKRPPVFNQTPPNKSLSKNSKIAAWVGLAIAAGGVALMVTNSGKVITNPHALVQNKQGNVPCTAYSFPITGGGSSSTTDTTCSYTVLREHTPVFKTGASMILVGGSISLLGLTHR